MNKIKQLFHLFLVILNLTGCAGSIYNSHFTCPDADGLMCEMLNVVDKKIDKGEMDKDYSKYLCKRSNKCTRIQNNKRV